MGETVRREAETVKREYVRADKRKSERRGRQRVRKEEGETE